MTDILLQITAFLVTVLALVSVHEWGHYITARMLGIKVLRYSIGFGRPIWRHTSKKGIEYVISWLPLGGYVKLLDEREGDIPEEEKKFAFNRQPLWSRSLVVIAGPLTNIIFAIFAYWMMFVIGFDSIKPIVHTVTTNTPAAYAGVPPESLIIEVDGKAATTWQDVVLATVERMGEQSSMSLVAKDSKGDTHEYLLDLSKWKIDGLNPQPLKSLGLMPYRPNIAATLDTVQKGGPASLAGLKAGDTILSVDGKKISDWIEFVHYLVPRPDTEVALSYSRDGKILTTNMTIGSRRVLSGFRKQGFIGVAVSPGEIPEKYKMLVKYSIFAAVGPATHETLSFFTFNFVVLKKMFKGEISLKSLGGPITIFKTANRAFREGVVVFLGFLALISTMLAFINVLPVPGLDGGHLLMFIIESVLGRPLSIAAEVLVMRIGMIMLLVLMVAATHNDIMRLF